jgi:hypothetical protein
MERTEGMIDMCKDLGINLSKSNDALVTLLKLQKEEVKDQLAASSLRVASRELFVQAFMNRK